MDGEETWVAQGASAGGQAGPDDLADGNRVGEYQVLGALGRGAMGQVYEVEHARLKRHYALKLLPSAIAHDRGFRERFEREGATLASLEHPGIVQVHYAGEDSGRFYLVMERLQPLFAPDAIGQQHPPEHVASMIAQVLDALGFAHERGVIHRDLKPANLLATPEGRVKIADFGVARVLGDQYLNTMVQETISRSRLGATATVADSSGTDMAGTLYYIAPEILNGQEADTRSDLYAVGVIAYELLTGKKPMGRYRDATKIVDGLDPRWDDFINCLLEPDPEDRYANATAAGEALQDIGKAPETAVADAFNPDAVGAVSPPLVPADSAKPAQAPTSAELDRVFGDAMKGTASAPPPLQSPTPPRPAAPPVSQPPPSVPPQAPQPTQAGPPPVATAPKKSRKKRRGVPLLILLMILAGGTAAAVYYGEGIWTALTEPGAAPVDNRGPEDRSAIEPADEVTTTASNAPTPETIESTEPETVAAAAQPEPVETAPSQNNLTQPATTPEPAQTTPEAADVVAASPESRPAPMTDPLTIEPEAVAPAPTPEPVIALAPEPEAAAATPPANENRLGQDPGGVDPVEAPVAVVPTPAPQPRFPAQTTAPSPEPTQSVPTAAPANRMAAAMEQQGQRVQALQAEVEKLRTEQAQLRQQLAAAEAEEPQTIRRPLVTGGTRTVTVRNNDDEIEQYKAEIARMQAQLATAENQLAAQINEMSQLAARFAQPTATTPAPPVRETPAANAANTNTNRAGQNQDVRLLENLAREGDASAQSALADLYREGRLVNRDYAQAAQWYAQAADSGDAHAQYQLGAFYVRGLGVSRNYNQALDLFSQASASGNADAQHSLGMLYENGMGVDPNPELALAWYKTAAANGHERAQRKVDALSDNDR
ncbi:MAG: protein kinase [Opitutales bacterium]